MSESRSPLLITSFSFRVGRDSRLVAVEVAVEPVELPVEAFYQVLRLAGAREVVVLAREDDELGRHAEVLERAEPLLALLQRHAVVVVRVKYECRRLDVSRVLQGRAIPVHFKLLEEVAAEVLSVSVCAVARALVADEVGEAAQGDCGLEDVGVSDDPVGHEAAVGAACDAEALAVNPGVFFERGLDAVHDVRVVLAAPLALYAALELLPVARRAARVAVEDGPPSRGVDLELLEPVNAVLACGAAVDAQDQRVLLPLLPAEGLDHEAVNVPSVRALVSHALNVRELEPRPESLVEAREFSFAAAVEVGRVDVVEVLEVVRGVDHSATAFVNVNGADGARPLCHLRNPPVLRVNAEEVLLAAHAGLAVESAPFFGPL